MDTPQRYLNSISHSEKSIALATSCTIDSQTTIDSSGGGIILEKHRKIQEYLKAILEYYDFDAELEHYISSTERTDVYGYSKSHRKSIGIEVSRTSDSKKDAEKLSKTNLNLAFVIVDNLDQEMRIEVHGKTIQVVHYKHFENELRRVLNISPSFPRFPSDFHLPPPSIVEEGKVEKFVQTLRESGLDDLIEDSINLLALIYIAKEIPSNIRDEVAYDLITRGVKTKRPEYVSVIEPRILSILKTFNLIFEEARGSGKLRKYFAELRQEEKTIAKEIVMS